MNKFQAYQVVGEFLELVKDVVSDPQKLKDAGDEIRQQLALNDVEMAKRIEFQDILSQADTKIHDLAVAAADAETKKTACDTRQAEIDKAVEDLQTYETTLEETKKELEALADSLEEKNQDLLVREDAVTKAQKTNEDLSASLLLREQAVTAREATFAKVTAMVNTVGA